MAMLNNQMVDPFSVQLEFAAGYPVIPHMFEKNPGRSPSTTFGSCRLSGTCKLSTTFRNLDG